MSFIEGQRVTLHHENRLHLDPEWIVIGVRVDATGEYAALAGLGLTEATLVSRARRLVDLMNTSVLDGGGGSETIEELHAKIGSYVIGFGATYAAALADLVRRWDPDDVTRPQLKK